MKVASQHFTKKREQVVTSKDINTMIEKQANLGNLESLVKRIKSVSGEEV
jgi:hypothetical protein